MFQVPGHPGPEVSVPSCPPRSDTMTTMLFLFDVCVCVFIRCAPAKDYFKDLSGHWSWAVQWLQKKASLGHSLILHTHPRYTHTSTPHTHTRTAAYNHQLVLSCQMSEHYWTPQSNVSNETSTAKTFQRTISAQVHRQTHSHVFI